MAVAREHVRVRGGAADLLPLLPVIGFLVAGAALPAAVLFGTAWVEGGGASAFLAAVADPLSVAAVQNSFLQGALSAAAAVALGFPAGVFLGRYHGRGRPVLLALFLVPFLIPVLVMVQGVEVLFGPLGYVASALPATSVLGSGLAGVVTVNVLFNTPIVVLLTAVGVERASGPLEATVATLGGGAYRRFRDVWGRGALLGAAAGGLVTFLFSALAFASPLLLCGARCYTVEVRVWSLDQEFGQPGVAALLGLALVILFAVPAFLYLVAAGRLAGGPEDAGVARPPRYGAPWVRRGLAVWTVLLLGAEFAVVVSVLIASVRPPGAAGVSGDAWAALFSPRVAGQLGIPAGGALANSLFFAAVCAGIALVLGILAGYWVRRRAGSALGVRGLLLLPLLLSPVLLAFALSSTWGALLAGPGNVWVLIVLSQATLALPFVIPTLLLALRPLSPAPRQSAELLGRTPFVAFLETELPRARTGLATAALLAFVIGLGEFTATFFLATPPFTTLPVAYYRLEELREPAAAAACGALLLIVSAVALVSIAWGGRRVAL